MGKNQEIETLINEEALLLAELLRNEKTLGNQELPIHVDEEPQSTGLLGRG
jgi:hypothetical protein